MTTKITKQLLSIALLFASALIGVADAAQRIELIAKNPSRFLAQGHTVTVHDLSVLPALEAELSQGLPTDEARAQAVLNARLTDSVKNALSQAWVGHLMVHRYQLTHLPAVVIDRKYVYYGYDVSRAVNLFKAEQE